MIFECRCASYHSFVHSFTSLSGLYNRRLYILSVTLFVVKINSITSCIKNGVDKSLFVDEIVVSFHSKHICQP